MIEDDGKFSLSIQESENINLKMEPYTIIGDANAIYNQGYETGFKKGEKQGYNKALEEYDLDQLFFVKTSDDSYNANSSRAFTEYITEIDFAKFSEKHKKTNFYNFFYYWGGKSLTVKNLDTSKAVSFRNMFYKCDYLTCLDVKGFDTSNVTNLYYAFSGCSSLKELDLSTWNTENVTDVTRMFSNNGSLEKLNLSSWHLPKVKSLSNVFIGCSKLKDIIWGQNWADNKDFISLELTECPLSKECIIDLADKIQDKSDTSLFPNTYKVVIASSQKSQFTEDELTSLANRFTSKNWSLVWS